MPVLPLDGTDLYYEIAGAGVPVLFVHGLGLDARMWDDQVAACRDIARTITYDARGFGRSSRRDADVGYTHADDAWALLDHLGIDDVVLVGLSMGGRIVIETLLDAPQRARALVLMDAVLDGISWDDESTRGMADIDVAMKSGGVPAANATWLKHPFFVPATRDPAVAVRLEQMVTAYCGRNWHEPDPHRSRQSVFDRLDRVHVPTTVIVGELDVPCFREMADVLATRIPGARKVVVPDAGHMVNMEAPALVNEVLRAVIAAAAG